MFAGTKAVVPELLESTLEHEISEEDEVLCHLPDTILKNLKHSCVCLELTNESFLGVWTRRLLAAQRLLSSLLHISQNKIVE